MLKINSVTVKTPKKITVGISNIIKNATSDAERNALGDAMIDRVAVKRKLDCEWGLLTNAEISGILSALTGVFFSVTYPDPETGAEKTITCFVTDKAAPIYRESDGEAQWSSLKIIFNEQ